YNVRRHRVVDLRIRGLEGGSRLSLAERHLAARYAARVRRPVRLVRAGDIRLCAGRPGRAADVVVAAAGARAPMSTRAGRTSRRKASGDSNEQAKYGAADARGDAERRGGAAAKQRHSLASEVACRHFGENALAGVARR